MSMFPLKNLARKGLIDESNTRFVVDDTGQVTEVRLSYYVVLLSNDSKTT